jgi:hypothetical protein
MNESYEDCRIINLNSKDAIQLNGDKLSNVVFKMNNLLKDTDEILYSTIGVINSQIPASYYLINSTNNILKINSNGIDYELILTKGNYSFSNLSTELIFQFNTIGITLALSLNKINGILTFTFSNNLTLIYVGSELLMTLLGFTSSVTGNIITAQYSLNLIGIKKIKINSVNLSSVSYDSSNIYSSDTIASIPVNASSFSLIAYSNQSSNYGRLKNRRIDSIDIQILDENGLFIEFNNINWCITLQLIVYTKYKNDTLELLVESINTNLQNLDNDLGNQKQQTTENDLANQNQKQDVMDDIPDIMKSDENDLDLLMKNN